LSLTLLRCVDWLSRDDFPTRRNQNAGPTVHTPDAQCQGERSFEYAVVPFAGDYRAAGLKNTSDGYRTAPRVIQGVEDGLTPGGRGLLEVAGENIAVTAVKKHHDRDALVVRFCNLEPRDCTVYLRTPAELTDAWRVDLLETKRLSKLAGPGVDGSFRVETGPHEIVTLEFTGGQATTGARY
jgi:alpha-mannosidase